MSTRDQHNEIQIRELTEYVERRGWELVGVYRDQVIGAEAWRPGLDELMADARLHKFDVVLVLKLDRFGRSLVNCVACLQELTTAGVRFIAVSQGLDTDPNSPRARLLLQILAAVAGIERELIKERVAAGIRKAKAKGTRIGCPPSVFDRQRALDMREQGMSLPAIGRALGVSYSTVARGIDALSRKRKAEPVRTS